MVRAWVCGRVGLKMCAMYSIDTRECSGTTVGLLWNSKLTHCCSGNMFLMHFCGLMLSVCLPICKCNSVTWCPAHTYVDLALCVSAYMSDRCCCGTRCTNTRWAAFNCSSKSRCVLNHRGLCLVGFLEARQGHERVRPCPAQPGVFSSRERFLIHTTLLIFPHHSPGQLHAKDIYLLYLMMETLSNMFWCVS